MALVVFDVLRKNAHFALPTIQRNEIDGSPWHEIFQMKESPLDGSSYHAAIFEKKSC